MIGRIFSTCLFTSLVAFGVKYIIEIYNKHNLYMCSCISKQVRNSFTNALVKNISTQFPNKRTLSIVSHCSGFLQHEAIICDELLFLGYSVKVYCIDLIYDSNKFIKPILRRKFKDFLHFNKKVEIDLFSSMDEFINQSNIECIDILMLIDPSFSKYVCYRELLAVLLTGKVYDNIIFAILDKEVMFRPDYSILLGKENIEKDLVISISEYNDQIDCI